MIREHDARFILNAVRQGNCISIVGLSNTGKSALLREVCAPAVQAELLGDEDDAWLFAYVDCNLMPELSEQALHEITLRSIITALQRSGMQDALAKRLDESYHQVVQPTAPIRSPLAFDNALRLVCEESGRALVILFDEFDDPFEKLTGRVFLNLRAMKDRFKNALVYVTATERPLAQVSQSADASEFIELFDTRERWIGFLDRNDATTLAREFTAGAPAVEADIAFIVRQAGGHAGLLETTAEVWRRIAGGVPDSARESALALVRQALDDQPPIRAECAKLWSQLSEAEQTALIGYVHSMPVAPEALEALRTKRLLGADGRDDEPLIGEIWRAFVHRQGLTREDLQRGVTVDVDAGEVYVDGRKIEPLTDLEYKLLLLLYGRLNKIVDKYTIVTNVWGETYLDAVDDARIEKLVSRLRSKLEPNAEEPRYLITLRGRGYKLVG